MRPGARIVYISGERFMNEYIHAIRTNRMHEFRRRYREGIDVLLVDDVQFLAGKDGTQDEFFHTFNALHDSHKQIVLTADRKPHEISDIADRLRTRFAWGLLADIEPPELEVRIAILRKKAAAEAIPLPDDVALYIATADQVERPRARGRAHPPRRLRLAVASARIDLDVRAARRSSGAITRPREHITVEHVLKAVASYYGLKSTDIKSPRRHKSLADPRAVAMYLARHAHQGELPRPRARVRRQAPHDRHLGRREDREAPQGRRRAAQRDPRDREPAPALTPAAAAVAVRRAPV